MANKIRCFYNRNKITYFLQASNHPEKHVIIKAAMKKNNRLNLILELCEVRWILLTKRNFFLIGL